MMDVWLAVLAVAVCLTVGLAYLLYTPIPGGFCHPWTVHLAYSSARSGKLLADFGELLGLGSSHVLYRKLFDFFGRLRTRMAGNNNKLKIVNTDFDGVPVRIYTPVGKPAACPGFIYYHGGGWTMGSIDAYDTFTQRLARGLNMVVLSVEYRLAPEHPFPAAFDDCVTATKFFLKNAADFGVDAPRVAIGGDSAGGNLAAAICIKLRQESFSPPVSMQVLLYPSLQALDQLTPSRQQNHRDQIIGLREMSSFWPFYVQGHCRNGQAIIRNMHTTPALKKRMATTYMDVSKLPQGMISAGYVPPGTDFGDENLYNELKHLLCNPYISPLVADDLSNLPKAYIFTGENDVLRDDGFWYAHRLREAGVDVHHRYSDIAFHGIFIYHDSVKEASAYTREIIEYIKENL